MTEQTDHFALSAPKFVLSALERFKDATGFEARLIPVEGAEPVQPGQDAIVELAILSRTRRYLATFRSIDRVQQIKLLVGRLSDSGLPRLLIAPTLTTTMAAQCRTEQQAYLDAAGNAFISGDDHYILIEGQKPGPGQKATKRHGSANPAALRVVFALLCRPELAAANYRDLASAAGTALGTVGATLTDLQNRRLLSPPGSTRRLLDPRRLLDEWATLYPLRLRPKLNVRRFSAPDGAWWLTAALPAGAVWGGEVAADRYTGYLKPEHITVYLDPSQDRQAFTRLITSQRLRPDPAGNIEFLDRFWPATGAGQTETGSAHPVLVYADLIASADPRNLETARRLKEQYLDKADDARAATHAEETTR